MKTKHLLLCLFILFCLYIIFNWDSIMEGFRTGLNAGI
jgi:hypothetical protein